MSREAHNEFPPPISNVWKLLENKTNKQKDNRQQQKKPNKQTTKTQRPENDGIQWSMIKI